MIGQNPKAEVAPSSVSRNRDKENQFLEQGSRWMNEGESRAKLRVKKVKYNLGQEELNASKPELYA